MPDKMTVAIDKTKRARKNGSIDLGAWPDCSGATISSGEYSILLQDGTKLTLSRNYKDKLFELLGKPL